MDFFFQNRIRKSQTNDRMLRKLVVDALGEFAVSGTHSRVGYKKRIHVWWYQSMAKAGLISAHEQWNYIGGDRLAYHGSERSVHITYPMVMHDSMAFQPEHALVEQTDDHWYLVVSDRMSFQMTNDFDIDVTTNEYQFPLWTNEWLESTLAGRGIPKTTAEWRATLKDLTRAPEYLAGLLH